MKTFIKWIISLFIVTEDVSKKPKKTRKLHKKPDTTKLTQHHYDFILASHKAWKEYNSGLPRESKIPVDALCREINQKLGLNKSNRALSRVWLGEINRDDLPVGKPINNKSEDYYALAS